MPVFGATRRLTQVPETQPDSDAFPPFARIGEVAIPLTLVVAVATQRDALFPPGWPLLLALAAAAPFVLDFLGVRVPLPVSTAVVLGAVLLLVLNPVNIDMAPFFLVFLGGHHALAGARRQSIVAVVGSLAVMIGVEAAGRYHGAFPYLLG